MLSFTWGTFAVTVDFTDTGEDVTTVKPAHNASCYYLSDVEEKYCDYNPVRTEDECMFYAAKFFNAQTAICCNESRNEGCERMPESCKLQGCVSDKKDLPGHHLVFWNGEHNSNQTSSDPKIRRICRGKEETPEKRRLDCNKSFYKKVFGFFAKVFHVILMYKF